VRRYERAASGEMIHIDIKKLGRFDKIGHRITGDRTGQIIAVVSQTWSDQGQPVEAPLDHDDFGSNRSKIMNVIDSNILERDAGGKPLHTFPHPALG
jgi:hypothetical protein